MVCFSNSLAASSLTHNPILCHIPKVNEPLTLHAILFPISLQLYFHFLHKVNVFQNKGVGIFSDNQIMTNNAKEFPNFFKVFLTKKHSDRMVFSYS